MKSNLEIRSACMDRFKRYVAVDTASSHETGTHPSTEKQFRLAEMLTAELKELGLIDVMRDDNCYVYGTMPQSKGSKGPAISFVAHMDTSPSEPGCDVMPRVIEKYDGESITFPHDGDLVLTPEESPELLLYKGETIITASGKTLLGADDKAGIAEIMTALWILKEDGGIPHPEIRVVFTPDEEIGEGTACINMKRLGKYGYTLDGSLEGHVEDECFDAYGVEVKFNGINVHPGFAKDRMVNAAQVACRYLSALPEWEKPEHTDGREGFFHLTDMNGDAGEAYLRFILRDFSRENNLKRIKDMETLKELFESRYKGLKIDIDVTDQYSNMKEELDKHPKVMDYVCRAVTMSGLKTVKTSIRGGTDGARLTFMGVPTPNIFAGGLMFHSKKEWIPVKAMEAAVMTVLNLCRLWAEG